MISRKEARQEARQERQELAELQTKENNRESYEKSVYSCGGGDEITIEPVEELVYDRIFFGSECPNYMPDHDIEKILTLYIHKIPRSFLPKGKGKKSA